MKAFVIKNKEGKYLEISVDYEGYDRLTFFEDIVDATVFDTKGYAEWTVSRTGLTDYTIVPITIGEVDLEEKCKELEKALELGAEKIEFMAQMLGQTLDYDIKENLIQQAKESDKNERD